MSRRKIAFGLGFAAIGLLLAEYLHLIIRIALHLPAGGGNLAGVIALITGVYLLPAIVATIFLLIARKYPHEAGILEMWEGGPGLVLGLLLFVQIIRSGELWDADLIPVPLLLAASILGSAALLMISGFFLIAQPKQEFSGLNGHDKPL